MSEEIRNPQPAEEEGIDTVALLKKLWKGRKAIIISTGVCLVIGLFAALSMSRAYTVTTVLVPQLGSSRQSSLASLATLAGFSLDMPISSAKDLSPLVYPQIVSSIPFRLELMHAPLHYAKVDTTISMIDYARDYTKPSVIGTIRKYTIGLPGVIKGALRKDVQDTTALALSRENGDEPLEVSPEEAKFLNTLASNVTLMVDKKEGYLTLSVTGSEPMQTADLAVKAQKLLQEEVTRFRTEKAEKQLEYIRARYYEIKAETEAYQTALATVIDRSQNMPTTRSRIEEERIRTKYTISNAIYAEMAKQLEQAKMQVKQDTPVLTVIQPVTVPLHPSNSRSKTLIIWIIFGIALGCGIVLAKDYFHKLKEMFADKPEEKK